MRRQSPVIARSSFANRNRPSYPRSGLIDQNVQLRTSLVLEGADYIRNPDTCQEYAWTNRSRELSLHRTAVNRSGTKYDLILCFEALLKLLCEKCQPSNSFSQMALYNFMHQNLQRLGVLTPCSFRAGPLDIIRNKYGDVLYSMMSTFQRTMPPTSSTVVRNEMLRPVGNRPDSELSTQYRIPQPFTYRNQTYKNEYEEVGPLGKGGYGKVFKVRNKLDKREYAMKKIHLSSNDPDRFEAFVREVVVFASLKHRNVVDYVCAWLERDLATSSLSSSHSSISDISEDMPRSNGWQGSTSTNEIQLTRVHGLEEMRYSAILFIQMELCSMTLYEWIDERNKKLPSVTDQFDVINEGESTSIFWQIVSGVKYLHLKGLIHRDLTPKNIFVNENISVKIGDFGLARYKSNASLEDLVDTGNVTCKNNMLTAEVGTITYAAPEQLSKNGQYDQKADMFPLGLIALELFYPFSTNMEKSKVFESLKTLSGLKEGLKLISAKWPTQKTVILSLLNPKPKLRPNTADLLRLMCKMKLSPHKKLPKHFKYLYKKFHRQNAIIKKQESVIAKQSSVTPRAICLGSD